MTEILCITEMLRAESEAIQSVNAWRLNSILNLIYRQNLLQTITINAPCISVLTLTGCRIRDTFRRISVKVECLFLGLTPNGALHLTSTLIPASPFPLGHGDISSVETMGCSGTSSRSDIAEHSEQFPATERATSRQDQS